jgi:hypothetical protein
MMAWTLEHKGEKVTNLQHLEEYFDIFPSFSIENYAQQLTNN